MQKGTALPTEAVPSYIRSSDHNRAVNHIIQTVNQRLAGHAFSLLKPHVQASDDAARAEPADIFCLFAGIIQIQLLLHPGNHVLDHHCEFALQAIPDAAAVK